MKYLPIVLFALLICFSSSAQKGKDKRQYDEVYRDQIHLSPEINKMGSPIALFVLDSMYHLYFQYNRQNLIDGYYNWGYATSKNLINWEQQDIVLKQPASETDSMLQTPWFGSVVNKEDALNIWYNRWGDGIYRTSSNNAEHINNSGRKLGIPVEQGEPYVFWHQASEKWVMFIYNRENTQVYIMISEDGNEWLETSSFNFNYGFPQVTELKVDRKPDDTRWLFLTEQGVYMLGEFDGKEFKISNALRKYNYGRKLGASVVSKDPLKDRTLLITQMKNDQMADLPSNGRLTIPAEIRLHEFQSGIELLQQPVEELQDMLYKTKRFEEEKVYPGLKNNLLKRYKGKELHIKGVINILSSDQFGFWIRKNNYEEGVEISYNIKNKLLSMIMTQIDYEPVNNKLEFEMIIDRSSVELYLEQGRYVISNTFEPIQNALDIELFTKGGEIMVEWMEVSRIKSAWEVEK